MHQYDLIALILVIIILGGIAYIVVFSLRKKWYASFGALLVIPGLLLLFMVWSVGPDAGDDEDAWIHSVGTDIPPLITKNGGKKRKHKRR